MQDFPGNSQRGKKPRPEVSIPEAGPKIDRVTSGEAVRKRKGLGQKFKGTFIEGDARSALGYMVSEVVVPAVRDTLHDALQSGLDQLIYGGNRPRRTSSLSSQPNVGRFNYQGISRPTTATTVAPNRAMPNQARARHDFGGIVIESRQEANEVLDSMYEILSRYETVSLANLYALTDIPSTHVDHKHGWTSLQGARAARQSDGRWRLELPEPIPLD